MMNPTVPAVAIPNFQLVLTVEQLATAAYQLQKDERIKLAQKLLAYDESTDDRLAQFRVTTARVNQISAEIAQRNGKPIDFDKLWAEMKTDQDERHDDIFSL